MIPRRVQFSAFLVYRNFAGTWCTSTGLERIDGQNTLTLRRIADLHTYGTTNHSKSRQMRWDARKDADVWHKSGVKKVAERLSTVEDSRAL